MHLRKPSQSQGFRDHPKFVAGHIYLRKGSSSDFYLACKGTSLHGLLHCLSNGNVWTTKGTAPFGDRGRVPLWEDVTDRVWLNDNMS